MCQLLSEGYCWHLVNPLNMSGHQKWTLVSATGQETGQSGIIYWTSLTKLLERLIILTTVALEATVDCCLVCFDDNAMGDI